MSRRRYPRSQNCKYVGERTVKDVVPAVQTNRVEVRMFFDILEIWPNCWSRFWERPLDSASGMRARKKNLTRSSRTTALDSGMVSCAKSISDDLLLDSKSLTRNAAQRCSCS